MRLTKNQQLQ